jgi:hypothetical protein
MSAEDTYQKAAKIAEFCNIKVDPSSCLVTDIILSQDYDPSLKMYPKVIEEFIPSEYITSIDFKIFEKINVLCITLNDDKAKKPLVIIPGYSDDSFCGFLQNLLPKIELIKKKYKEIYVIHWSDKIKKYSEEIVQPYKSEPSKAMVMQDAFRVVAAKAIAQILSSDRIDIKEFDLMAKSTGGGIGLYLIGLKKFDIDTFYMICGASSIRTKQIEGIEGLTVKMMWNMDDQKVPFNNVGLEMVQGFSLLKIPTTLYLYNIGGHELNSQFIIESIQD